MPADPGCLQRMEVSGDTKHRVKNQSAKKLILEWLADESGYDEETWPVLKRAIALYTSDDTQLGE